MTNREYAIKKINEVLERVDDTRLADIFIEVVQFSQRSVNGAPTIVINAIAHEA